MYPREVAVLTGGSKRPVLDLNFANGPSSDPRLTFTRAAGGGTYFDATGTLQLAAANQQRIDYGWNPSGGTINWLRNSTMQGAQIGNPGVEPTYWNYSILSNGVAANIVGFGTEFNLPYIDLQLVGTCTASTPLRINFDGGVNIPALNGDTWTLSVYTRLISGSLGDAVYKTIVGENNSSGTVLNQTITQTATVTSALQRFTQTYTNSNSSTAFESCGTRLDFITSSVYNFTLRLYAPQLENSPIATPFVPTFGAIASGNFKSGTTNMVFPSQGPWGLSGTGTVTLNATAAPDGTTTATLMTADATLGSHGFNLGNMFASPSTYYTASMYAKAGTSSKVGLDLRLGSDWVGGVVQGSFDLSAVTATCINGSGTCAITPVGNGWFRCSTTGLSSALPLSSFPLWSYVQNAAGQNSYAGSGESAYFWGFQTEKGQVPTTYVFTTNAPVNVGATAIGILIEEKRTNSIRNPRCEGSVTGTPGTMPTNWVIDVLKNAIQSQVVGSGYENGIPYIDVRWAGTPTGTGQNLIQFETSTGVPAVAGQAWTGSFYHRLVGGSLANVTLNHILTERDAAGAPLVASGNFAFVPNASALASTRLTSSYTLVNASTAFIFNYIGIAYTSGLAVDFTLRIGCPQLEKSQNNTGATSPILPPINNPAAALRSDETVTMPATGLYGGNSSTIQFEGMLNMSDNGGNNANLIRFEDGFAGTNRLQIMLGGVTPAGQVNALNGAESTSVTLATPFKFAICATAQRYASCLNGGAVNSKANTAMPTGIAALKFQTLGASSVCASAYMSRARIWLRAVSDAELQTNTT